MPGTQDLALFIVAGLLLNITPGPDTLYIVGRSTTQGLRAGAAAALGIGAGTLIHVSAAAFGLSALFAASAAAFTVLKLVGAAYLVYIGIALIRSRPGAPTVLRPAGLRTVFVQGFWTNVLNPKVALFFLAFLPQFVDPTTPDKVMPLLFLGLVFNVNGTLWNLFVAWSTARLGGLLMRSTAAQAWFSRVVGGLFIVLAARLALTRQ